MPKTENEIPEELDLSVLPAVMRCRPIDGKYSAAWDSKNERVVIINTRTGAVLPDDEPLILFRAKDWLVRRLIAFYQELCVANKCSPEHVTGVDVELRRFEEWAAAHPLKLKNPD